MDFQVKGSFECRVTTIAPHSRPSADDVCSNNICCLSKLWQLRLALLSNVALLVWCHSRYFSTFIGHGKQRKYQNYFQCTNLATCIPGKRLAFNKIMGLEKSNGGRKGNFHTQKKIRKRKVVLSNLPRRS